MRMVVIPDGSLIEFTFRMRHPGENGFLNAINGLHAMKVMAGSRVSYIQKLNFYK